MGRGFPDEGSERAVGGAQVKALRAARPEAAAAIWRWREAKADTGAGPSAASVRLRGLLQSLVGYSVSAAFYWFWSPVPALIAFALTSVMLLSALLSPHGLYALVHRLFDATGRVVGRATTWAVMAPIFYLFFVPFGKLMRRGRRDRMRRYYESEAESYWEPHSPMQTSTLERQY
jgi:hypothetical protein